MPSVLITGANRGLGLEFCRQYAAGGWRVYACCRRPESADELGELAGDDLTVHRLDVTDAGHVGTLAQELKGQPIDILLNNAGVIGPQGDSTDPGATQSLRSMDYDGWMQTFAVNTLGPMRMVQAFLENVGASKMKKVMSMTSRMGSITESGNGYYAYRSSKAALNAVIRTMAGELRERGITLAVFHPGWAQTAMGGPSATLPVDESVSALRKLFEDLSLAESGRFYLYDGADIPW